MISRMFARLWASLCRWCLILSGGVCLGGLAAMVARFPLPGLVLCLGMIWRCFGRSTVSTNYGSATIASSTLLERQGFMDGKGLILGRCLPEKPSKREAVAALLSPRMRSEMACRMVFASFLHRSWFGGRLVQTTDFVHLASFSPAGGGKGTAVLLPNLRSYAGSCVVTDPKPELTGLTAKFRRKKFGHKIIILDPFNRAKMGSATLNPLDWIAKDADDFLDQCRELANMLVLRTGKETDRHWNDSCELVLTAIIAFVCGCEPDKAKRNFQTVRLILSSRHAFDRAVEVMQQMTDCQGVVARLGGQLTWFQDKELGSVLTTVQRTTQFLDSPVVAANTNTSSFDPMILRKRKATIYLILPPDKLQSLSGLLRMQIGTIMRRITSGPPTEKNPVLWFLDEYAHLGKIEAVEDAVTLKRGMGMRLWFFFQSKEQMKLCFGDKASTISDNIGTQQYFGITSFETADELSKRIGDATIAIETSSSSRSVSNPFGGDGASKQPSSRSTSHTTNRSEIARRLLKPEEILQLHDLVLIFHKHLPVIPARLVKWYNSPEFAWGGTGRQGGLGLVGGLVAAVILAASLAFGSVAVSIASMKPIEPSHPAGGGYHRPPVYPVPAGNHRRFR